jgi:hypothetical protein
MTDSRRSPEILNQGQWQREMLRLEPIRELFRHEIWQLTLVALPMYAARTLVL